MENNEMNVQNSETIEPVVKQKSNKGLVVLIIILILMVLGLGGYLVYDKFIAKDKTPMSADQKDTKEDYVGYYSGCSKNLEGDEVCAELVLNNDKTAYLLEDPISSAAVVGTYSIENNTLTINSTYKLASENAGKDVEVYKLKIYDNAIVYNFNNGVSNIDFKLIKTTKEKLNMYNQMDKGEIGLNQTNVTTNTEYDIVKKVFANEYLLNSEYEKLLDYRIEQIKVLSGSEKQEILGYQSTDILADVKYSVKVNDPNTSNWLAGNGEATYGNWLLGKSAVVTIRDGKLETIGTGW